MSATPREIETVRHSTVGTAVLPRPSRRDYRRRSAPTHGARTGENRWARWLRESTKVPAHVHGKEPGLDELIESVRAASRQDRISYRGGLAAFGSEAIKAVSPWLADPEFGAFAVRVIQAAATGEARDEGIAALRNRKRAAATAAIKQDIDFALDQLGARRRTASATPKEPGIS